MSIQQIVLHSNHSLTTNYAKIQIRMKETEIENCSFDINPMSQKFGSNLNSVPNVYAVCLKQLQINSTFNN